MQRSCDQREDGAADTAVPPCSPVPQQATPMSSEPSTPAPRSPSPYPQTTPASSEPSTPVPHASSSKQQASPASSTSSKRKNAGRANIRWADKNIPIAEAVRDKRLYFKQQNKQTIRLSKKDWVEVTDILNGQWKLDVPDLSTRVQRQFQALCSKWRSASSFHRKHQAATGLGTYPPGTSYKTIAESEPSLSHMTNQAKVADELRDCFEDISDVCRGVMASGKFAQTAESLAAPADTSAEDSSSSETPAARRRRSTRTAHVAEDVKAMVSESRKHTSHVLEQLRDSHKHAHASQQQSTDAFKTLVEEGRENTSKILQGLKETQQQSTAAMTTLAQTMQEFLNKMSPRD